MKTTTLVVLSLDVAIYPPLSLPNHTIILELKKREGDQRKARMQSGWEFANRKVAGILNTDNRRWNDMWVLPCQIATAGKMPTRFQRISS